MDWAFFSVNGLGLNFCGIFEEKKLSRSDFGKRRREKSSEISVRFENLEEMSKWTKSVLAFLAGKGVETGR